MKKHPRLFLPLFIALFAIVVSVALALPCFGGYFDENEVWYPDKFEWTEIPRDENVVARFAMGADIHYGVSSYGAVYKLPTVYCALKEFGGVDALCISGDLNHFGREEVYYELMDAVRQYSSELTVDFDGFDTTCEGDAVGTTVISMGNHETVPEEGGNRGKFTRVVGQEPTKLYWVAGIPIIKMSPDDAVESNSYREQEEEILAMFAEVDASGYEGPIIGMAHHRVPTSMPESGENSTWSKAELQCFVDHPNLILFTGHSHTNFYNTREFIEQDLGFTMVRSGVLGIAYGGSYINPISGREEGPTFNGSADVCSFVLMDILNDGRVKLRRVDISKGEFVFPNEEFIIDTNDLDSEGKLHSYFSRSHDKGTYGYGRKKPVFPEGAEVSVTPNPDHSSVTVTFPSASPATSLARDYIYRYRITLTDPDGEQIVNYVMNDGYLSVPHTEWNVPIHLLKPDTDYTVEVAAQSAYQSTTALTYEGTVNVGHLDVRPAEIMFSVDATNGSYEEETGRELVGTPIRPGTVDDKDIGRKVLKFLGLGAYSYKASQEDYDNYRTDFTYEAYFKTNDTGSPQIIVGSIDSLSSCLRIENGKIWLWGSFRSMEVSQEARLVVGCDIEPNTWYHVVGTYDGYWAKIYVNGELAGERAASGGVDPSTTEEWTICVGGGSADPNSYIAYLMNNGCINFARLYKGVMTEDEIRAAYEATKEKPVEIVDTSKIFRDVKEKSWFKEAVDFAYSYGLMNGTAADVFDPNAPMSRAMIVTVLWRVEGSPEPKGASAFTDLKANWYKKAVAWAAENGIVNGMSATSFAPDDPLTREQIAAIMQRYAAFKGEDVTAEADLSAFPDAGQVHKYARDAVLWAVDRGLISGVKSGNVNLLDPRGGATRAQVATILMRYLKK